jgi:signal transduction histidine kinase
VARHNASFAAWAGRADPTGAALGELFPGDPVVARLWDEARAHALVEHHVERRGPDGVPSFWSVQARKVAAGVLVSAADVTAVAEAAHAVHDVQRTFVGGAAHELRAPLAAIKAWASALHARRRGAGRPEDEPLLDDGLGAIARQVDRMNELLTDLLEAARSDAGALRAARRAVPVREIVARALDAAPAAPRAAVTSLLPDDRVLVDPGQIEAALGRLVSCVARRQPEGTIAVTVARTGAEVHVTVADTAPLPPAAEADLFGRTPRAGRGRGVGLGLHVAQLLAAASGARVWREHDAGGARFVLALPAAGDAPPLERAPGPMRVLAVLREEGGLAARVASVLRLYGHVAATAATVGAIEGPFDVVLLDPTLPGVGLEAVAELHEGTDPPAIVVITARPEAAAGAPRAGALAVLPEPIDWAHLLSLVQTAAAARGAV